MMMLPVDQDGHCMGPNSSSEPVSIFLKLGNQKGRWKKGSQETNASHSGYERVHEQPSKCTSSEGNADHPSDPGSRLYHQVEMMVRYYRIPILLIEFSQDKSFSFLSTSEIGDDVAPNSIISKLSLLALHFPRLRVMWSCSLHATAEIYASLKANQDEPDEAKATRVGVPSEEGVVEDDVIAENYNTSAIEFLRRLPGVTDSNYRAIMDGCESLAELALVPMERLAQLMGGQKAAKTLRDFLDAKYLTLL